jgi:hypothetical protein
MVAKQDDERLREVKAVLQSLSQIGGDRPPAVSATGETGHNVSTLESAGRRSVSRTPGSASNEASRKRRSQKQLGAFALATLAGGTVLVLAADLFFKYWPAPAPETSRSIAFTPVTSSPPVAAAARAVAPVSGSPAGTAQPSAQLPVVAAVIPATPPSPAIASAKQLMDAGKVVAARGLLQQPTLASSQDAAWLLARSYDPNYLANIKSPDASGDKEKAAEWYRKWRDIGAQRGVQIDDVHLKRLVETLD